jgi:putative DNA primase/helicase
MSKDETISQLREQGSSLNAGMSQDKTRIAKKRHSAIYRSPRVERILEVCCNPNASITETVNLGPWDSEDNAIRMGCSVKGEVNHVVCVNYIMQNIRVKNIRRTSKNGVQYTMYYYSEIDGAYHPGAEHIIRASVDNLLGELTSTYHKREIVDMIGNSTMVDSSIIQDTHPFRDWVLLNNGRLNVFTREFRPGFTPEEVYLHPLPIVYDPKATCPEIDKFIEMVVAPEDRAILYEIPAYGLMPGYRFHKVPMFYSPGRSGRSTYMTMLTHFFGEDNVSHVSMHSLCNERFSAATLYGARLNLAGEISIRDITDTGRFKSAVGEDDLYAENKCQQPFSFKNEAKFIFAANVLPQFKDESDGLWARLIPVEFTHNFEREGTMVEDYASKLTTGSELSGLLNRALDALQHLVKNPGFSKKMGTDEVREWWYSKTDSVIAFTSEASGYVTFDSLDSNEVFVPRESVRYAYEEYCRKNRISPASRKDFKRRMKEILEDLVGYRTEMQPTPEQSETHGIERYGEGKRPVCYNGIDFTEEYKQKLLEKKVIAKQRTKEQLVPNKDEGTSKNNKCGLDLFDDCRTSSLKAECASP